MTKDELKKFIQNLALDEKFAKLILQMIEDSQKITPELLNGLADILQSYAEYQNNLANSYEQIATEIEKVGAQLQELDDKEMQEKLEAVNNAQEQAFANISEKIQELKQ